MYTERDTRKWICISCSSRLFPFNDTRDEGEFLSRLSESWDLTHSKLPSSIARLMEESYNFNPLDLDESMNSPFFDINPDLNHLNSMYVSDNLLSCHYFIANTFKSKLQNTNVTRESLSMIHLNMRSASRDKMPQLEAYLSTLDHDFTIIGMSETWFSDAYQATIPCYINDPNLHTYCAASAAVHPASCAYTMMPW